jgi:hypothetical protein
MQCWWIFDFEIDYKYIFSSCMHSKRYSQEEVRFRSQMLYHSYLFKCRL